MNKYEREVARSQLESERKVLEELEKIYSQAAADITKRLEITNGKIEIMLNEIDKADEKTLSVLQSQIYQRDFQKNIKKQLDFILESLNDNQYPKIYDYLKKSYDNGFIGTLYSLNMSGIPVNIPIDPVLVARAIHIESKLSKKLYESLGEDVEILKKRVTNSISRGIASGMHYSEIALNIANNSKSGVNNAMRIVRTEGGRIYSNAAIECGKAAKEKTGADLIKQWDSTLDGVTRPHHRQLDGQVRELEEDFEVGNRKTSAPLHFGIPGEDINCRCISLIKPRWDVDEAFTKRDNASGELLEFEGTKDYEDFKKRYWKSVDKSQKSGIIKVGRQRGISDMNAIKEKHTAAGNRRSPFYELSSDDIEYVKNEIKQIGANADDFVFNSETVRGTCFLASDGKVHVKGNVFPDETSNHPRDIMSVRAVLAHEYYGHRPYREQYIKEDNDTSPEAINKIMARAWADEFRASYMAAKNAPNLSDEDRYLLIRDSLSRAEEAGISIKYNDFIRRVLYG